MNSSKTQSGIAKIARVFVSLALNLVLFTAILLGFSGLYQAIAAPLTTQINPAQLAQVNYSRTDLDHQLDVKENDSGENLIDTTREKLKETADTIREKLNLDEPISPSTKAFAEDVKEKVTHPLSKGDPEGNQSNWSYQN